MYKNKRIRAVYACIVFVFAIACCGMLSNAKEETVIVGYTVNSQMIHHHDNDKLYGYGVAYLEALEHHGNFKFEYMPVAEEDQLRLLQDGTIDLLCDITENAENKNALLYSDKASGMEYALLYAAEDNQNIFYDERQSMQNCRVGIDRNESLSVSLLENYENEHYIRTEKVYYDNIGELTEALDNQEIDLIYASSVHIINSVKLVARVDTAYTYFVTASDRQELMDKLNEAQKKLYEETPEFDSILYTKYYDKHREGLIDITRAEYSYIKTLKPVRVAVPARDYPITYYDENAKACAGVEPSVLALMAEKSGLTFEYVPVVSAGNAIELIEEGKADMMCGFYAGELSTGHYQLNTTAPYMSMDYTVLTAGSNSEMAEIQTIALPKGNIAIQYYMMDEHPEWKIIYRDTIQDCINAVIAGKADITVVNSLRLQTNFSIEDLKDVKILVTEAMSMDVSYAIGEHMPPVFLTIMDKTIRAVPDTTIKACISQNSVSVTNHATISEMIVKFTPHMLALAGILLSVFLLILRQRELHYKKLATEDAVSGLWTGMKFRKEATEIINQNKQTEYYLISCDIEKFKNMNNSLGSKTADKILSVLAIRLQELFGNKAFYARDMADMFLIMTERCSDLEETIDSISKEFYVNQNGRNYYYSLSIKFGVTLIEAHRKTEVIEKYINQAISARKSIKGKVGIDIAFYDDRMKQEYQREDLIEQQMNQALDNREFVVYYQPKYDLETESLTGAEALVRWKKPDGSLVPPNHFIPLFEKNGFIVQLDFYVFEEVMKNLAEWKAQGQTLVPISVNVSRLHVSMPSFLDRMLDLTKKYNVSSSLIELELTESTMSEDTDNIMTFLTKCHNAGFKLSMDDFGSGYSSLNLLKELPFDVLKIDKEFLSEAGNSARSTIIIEQVIQMAKRIHIDTLCEGVETREQADFLKRIGCHMVQGFLFSRPLPREEFDKLL